MSRAALALAALAAAGLVASSEASASLVATEIELFSGDRTAARLVWIPVHLAAGYRIYGAATHAGPFSLVAEAAASEKEIVVTFPPPGYLERWFIVAALDDSGREAAPSEPVCWTAESDAPPPPGTTRRVPVADPPAGHAPVADAGEIGLRVSPVALRDGLEWVLPPGGSTWTLRFATSRGEAQGDAAIDPAKPTWDLRVAPSGRLLRSGDYHVLAVSPSRGRTRFSLNVQYRGPDGGYALTDRDRRRATRVSLRYVPAVAAFGALLGYSHSFSKPTSGGFDRNLDWFRADPRRGLAVGAALGLAVGVPVSLTAFRRIHLGRYGRRLDPNDLDEAARANVTVHARLAPFDPQAEGASESRIALDRTSVGAGSAVTLALRNEQPSQPCPARIYDPEGRQVAELELGASPATWDMRPAVLAGSLAEGDYEASISCPGSLEARQRLRVSFSLPGGPGVPPAERARARRWGAFALGGILGIAMLDATVSAFVPYKGGPPRHEKYGWGRMLGAGAAIGLAAGIPIGLAVHFGILHRSIHPIRVDRLTDAERERLVVRVEGLAPDE